jgi:NAD(P)-dependent dehydrogenase (short-subunit alcohol dehydrogenase family)
MLKSEIGKNCVISKFDITNECETKESVDTIISKEGHLDILINCAGGSARNKMAMLVEQDLEVIYTVLTSNLKGTIICSKYAAKYMVSQKNGVIINIGSTTGIQGNTGNCDYATAKSGIIGFTKALAQEVGLFQVRVNCVSPGFIQTGEFDSDRVEYLRKSNFLNAVGEPEDIAHAVEFLVSDRAKFITGINLVVDGGRILGLHTFNS